MRVCQTTWSIGVEWDLFCANFPQDTDYYIYFFMGSLMGNITFRATLSTAVLVGKLLSLYTFKNVRWLCGHSGVICTRMYQNLFGELSPFTPPCSHPRGWYHTASWNHWKFAQGPCVSCKAGPWWGAPLITTLTESLGFYSQLPSPLSAH